MPESTTTTDLPPRARTLLVALNAHAGHDNDPVHYEDRPRGRCHVAGLDVNDTTIRELTKRGLLTDEPHAHGDDDATGTLRLTDLGRIEAGRA